jgi:hypothetical protein
MKSPTTATAKALNQYRWQIAMRVLAAMLGGYVLANAASILLSFIVPMTRSDAVMTAMLVSFAIYTGAVLWVFAVRTLSKAWLGLIVPSLVLGSFALVLKLAGVAG